MSSWQKTEFVTFPAALSNRYPQQSAVPAGLSGARWAGSGEWLQANFSQITSTERRESGAVKQDPSGGTRSSKHGEEFGSKQQVPKFKGERNERRQWQEQGWARESLWSSLSLTLSALTLRASSVNQQGPTVVDCCIYTLTYFSRSAENCYPYYYSSKHFTLSWARSCKAKLPSVFQSVHKCKKEVAGA